MTIGPVIENGFYYDFSYKRPFTPEDLAAIEKRDDEARRRRTSRSRARVMPRDEAVAFFKRIGEDYKARDHRRRFPPNERSVALSRGRVHRPVPRPARAVHAASCKAFKLMKVAGAYWRGDSNNEMLQRIYGTAWANEEGPGRVPAAARGGREARPPQARQAARPVPHAGRGAGHGVLASEGLGDLAAGRAVHARASTATTATRKCAARRSSTCRCGRSPGHWENYKRQHVHDRVGEARRTRSSR